MKLKNILTLLVLGSVLTITAVGCKTKPQRTTQIPGFPNGRGEQAPSDLTTAPKFGDGSGVGGSTVDSTAFKSTGIPPTDPSDLLKRKQDRDALKAESVYFDFDRSTIRSSEQSKLDKVADYLKSNASAALLVEGNCDERGTEEYNRSLGERRALASREYLVRLGIDAGRVVTLSNGQDKPAEVGHSEEFWSKNRRDDFIVLIAPGM